MLTIPALTPSVPFLGVKMTPKQFSKEAPEKVWILYPETP